MISYLNTPLLYLVYKLFIPLLIIYFINRMELFKYPDEDLVKELRRRYKCKKVTEPKRVILLGNHNKKGPPGSGRGTMGSRLQRKFCMCALSTGDMLRDEIRAETELGKIVDKAIKNGELVNDELVFDLLKKNLERFQI